MAVSVGHSATYEDPWTMEAQDETLYNKATPFEPTLTNLSAPADCTLTATALSEEFSATEPTANWPQPGPAEASVVAPPPALPQKRVKVGTRVFSPVLIAVILLVAAWLGLLSTRPLAPSVDPSYGLLLQNQNKEQQEQQRQVLQQQGLQEKEQTQEKEQQQHPKERDAKQKLLKKLDKIQHLNAVVDELVEALGSGDDEMHAALVDVRKSLERANEVRKKVLRGSLDSSESPERLMQNALDESDSAVSRLCESARKGGLWLAERTRRIEPPSPLSVRELEAVAGVDQESTDSLSYHLGNLMFSFQASMRQATEVYAKLKAPQAYAGVDHGMLLAGVAADSAIIKRAYELAQQERRSTDDLATAATTLVLSHSVREQVCMYRQCRDLLEEHKTLCKAERERQQQLPKRDEGVLEALDKIEEDLHRGGILLKKHALEIDQLRRQKDIKSAQDAREQAGEVGEELQSLLEDVSSRMVSITGAATDKAQGQLVMKKIASRASHEAEAAAKKVKEILKAMRERGVPLQSLTETQVQSQTGSVDNSLTNPSILEELQRSLQHIGRMAQEASSEAARAAAEAKLGSSCPPERMKELVDAARKAAVEAETLLGKAEVLWFQSQLLEALEQDIQISVSVADGAVAAQERARQQQMLYSEMTPSENERRGTLLKQVESLRRAVMLQTDLQGLSSSGAALKGAVMQLVSLIQKDRQNLP